MNVYYKGKSLSTRKVNSLKGYHPDFFEDDYLKYVIEAVLSDKELHKKQYLFERFEGEKQLFVFGGCLNEYKEYLIGVYLRYSPNRNNRDITFFIYKITLETKHSYGRIDILGYTIDWEHNQSLSYDWNLGSISKLSIYKTRPCEYKNVEHVVTERANNGIEHVICMHYEVYKNNLRFKELQELISKPTVKVVPEIEEPVVEPQEVKPLTSPIRDSKGRFIPKSKIEAVVELPKVTLQRDSKGRFIKQS